MTDFKTVYPVSSTLIPLSIINSVGIHQLCPFLEQNPEHCSRHPYLADLARVEYHFFLLSQRSPSPSPDSGQRTINPDLQLLEMSWLNLPEFLENQSISVQPGEDRVLIWLHPEKKTVLLRSATGRDLLALKIVSEGLTSRVVAEEAGLTIGEVDNIVYNAEAQGLIISPPSGIVRPADFHHGVVKNDELFTTPTFTLQWHLTQNCDLHCRHCYDRSDRTTMTLDQGLHVLDELYDFCQAHHVFTQISFTGGNPLLHPDFNTLYREAADRGFLTAILGNPMPEKSITPILEVQELEFYQISLEGLEEHNDYIRGKGHFQRAFTFLDLLKELGVFSMVMLTLTRDNQDQVLELAELLRDRVDLFTFNRLSMVGEGAALASAPVKGYRDFLRQYSEAARDNPCMRLKDNLFNLLRYQCDEPLLGGCAGRGCGAAFNFVSLLPDGEIHACRKLPSYLGNLYTSSLDEIYHSTPAQRYRMGSEACSSCEIRPVCGGCPAVSYGQGLDIFKDRDPHCFYEKEKSRA
ncbi:MAG: thio(seleno)oxazole modification radical SAM maturase SbtM [Thermodesulfobacteriota bacterium]